MEHIEYDGLDDILLCKEILDSSALLNDSGLDSSNLYDLAFYDNQMARNDNESCGISVLDTLELDTPDFDLSVSIFFPPFDSTFYFAFCNFLKYCGFHFVCRISIFVLKTVSFSGWEGCEVLHWYKIQKLFHSIAPIFFLSSFNCSGFSSFGCCKYRASSLGCHDVKLLSL